MPVELQCPSTATVEILQDLEPVLRLACFGGSDVTPEGDVTCPDLEPQIPVSQPDWLTWDACHIKPSRAQPHDPRQGRTNLGIAIHYPQGLSARADRCASSVTSMIRARRRACCFDPSRNRTCMGRSSVAGRHSSAVAPAWSLTRHVPRDGGRGAGAKPGK